MPPASVSLLRNQLAPAAQDGPLLVMTKSIIVVVLDNFVISQGSDEAMAPPSTLEHFRDDNPPKAPSSIVTAYIPNTLLHSARRFGPAGDLHRVRV
jgi:Asp/Glu/hydantoin racemase